MIECNGDTFSNRQALFIIYQRVGSLPISEKSYDILRTKI